MVYNGTNGDHSVWAYFREGLKQQLNKPVQIKILGCLLKYIKVHLMDLHRRHGQLSLVGTREEQKRHY